MSEYQPTGLSNTIFSGKYTIHPDETWKQAGRRVAHHVAGAEGDNAGEIEEQFYDQIVSNKFMPGGRIWYGAGRPRGQMLNCFVLKMPGDSREGWGKAINDMLIISGTGGGVGINFSSVRPRGSKINGTGGTATGAVSLMNMINGVGGELVSGGARRVALMMDLNITHPDVLEFIDAKLDRGKLNNANVSVVLDKRMGAKAFVDAVNGWLASRLRAFPADPGTLDRLARIWQEFNQSSLDTETFNLERKPLVFNLFMALAHAGRAC